VKRTCILAASVLSASLLTLTGCGGSNESGQMPAPLEKEALNVSGAKSAIFSLIMFSPAEDATPAITRPGAALGLYVGVYLAQGTTLPVLGALIGVDTQLKLAESDNSVEKDETFVLLEEYGTVLQVDIIDTLNRSSERAKTLDKYIRSLEAMNARAQAKMDELDTKLAALKDERRDQRSVVRAIEREIRTAIKEENYSLAGPKQEQVTKEKAELSEIESKEKQIKNIRKIYDKLISVGSERALAITKNREVLIAGLKVIDVPGIEDLEILIEE